MWNGWVERVERVEWTVERVERVERAERTERAGRTDGRTDEQILGPSYIDEPCLLTQMLWQLHTYLPGQSSWARSGGKILRTVRGF